MTVAELIEQLQQYPLDTVVVNDLGILKAKIYRLKKNIIMAIPPIHIVKF